VPGAREPAAVLVDDFEDVTRWTAHPADGVEMRLSSAPGEHGQALRIDFRFRGGGYAVARRELDLPLPENYAFQFRIRGQGPANHLEFKLVDGSGENVWWRNRRDFEFPPRWRTETIRRRQIEFAWGPAGGGEIRRVAAIEFAVTAGSGGEGTVWLDRLELRELPPAPAGARPVARASSSRRGRPAEHALDGDPATEWWSGQHDRLPWLEVDLGWERELGGLVIDWSRGRHARHYAVEAGAGGDSWTTLRVVTTGNGGRDHLHLPESAARRLRLRALSPPGVGGLGIAAVAVQPPEWAPSANAFFQALAREAPRGRYPRGFVEQVYWTVFGEEGRAEEGLMSEDGAIEAGPGAFSVEPFLFADGRLWNWSDVSATHTLAEGSLPLPAVRWEAGDLELTVTAFAADSALFPRYALRRRSGGRGRVTLYLAVRPFQVNPPSQTLNAPGGVAPIRRLALNRRHLLVNEDRRLIALRAPDGFGATTFDQGDVVEFLERGALPPARGVNDPVGFASGALAYRFTLAAGEEAEVDLRIPLQPAGGPAGRGAQAVVARAFEWIARRPEPRHAARLAERFAAQRRRWREALGPATLELPDAGAEVRRTLRAQIGHILVNRDRAALQPGSRAYDRSWIRDGALTSSALLRLGHGEVVRAFMEWFAGFQYPSGKVPCCVDRRGADPVPEHDSHGEFIFLVAEHLRYTGDRAAAERMWPHVLGAANHLDSLRRQRRTAEYQAPGRRHFFGLLPPSISHEGYSAKPMHSYWDGFFALRGFKDAAFLAAALGRPEQAARLAAIRDEFAADLARSIAAAMAHHRVDYVPGCADLGDFDATSTTIALAPVQAEDVVPAGALRRTFERYWEFFDVRRRGRDWDAYTPYELRNVGAFVRLGWRDRAHELLDFFMAHRRPPGWAQWAEVVGREERAPRFIGDMPHTWVGSDYVRSVLDMIAYDRESDSSLVIGAGVPAAWLEGGGVVVRGLRTVAGALDLVLQRSGQAIEARLDRVGVPPGGFVVAPPGVTPAWRASVNGRAVSIGPAGEVRTREVPATIRFEPRGP
jgi:hypothetical protein